MPDVTDLLSIPYPLPGDAVTDYPTTGRELAERLELLLASVGEVQVNEAAWSVSINTDPNIANAVEILPVGVPTVPFDGSPCIFDFFAPIVYMPAGQTLTFVLWDSAGSPCGQLGIITNGGGGSNFPFAASARWVPPAGNRAYYVRAYRGNTTSGVPTVTGGAVVTEGSQGWVPISLRVRKAGTAIVPAAAEILAELAGLELEESPAIPLSIADETPAPTEPLPHPLDHTWLTDFVEAMSPEERAAFRDAIAAP